jgi:hypothetical protein
LAAIQLDEGTGSICRGKQVPLEAIENRALRRGAADNIHSNHSANIRTDRETGLTGAEIAMLKTI